MPADAAEAPRARKVGARPGWILAGLAAGLALGAGGRQLLGTNFEYLIDAAGFVGGMWLDALRMTIVPLVFALVVTGMATAARTLQGGGVAARALILFALLLLGSAAVCAMIAAPAIDWWSPAPGAFAGLAGPGPVPDTPGLAQGLRAMVPTNVVAAAASDAIVPLVLFALLLGIAVTRIGEAEHRAAVTALFAGFADALLVIVGWILALAPLGVFALAITAGARLGMDAGAALAFYVGLQIVLALILTLLMVLLAATLGRTSPARFATAAAPAQAVALSTQSSLASLPAMLASAQRLGLPEQSTAVVLPLAVATFKISAPLTGVVVGLTLAKLAGVEVGGWQLLAGILLAAISTLAVVGLPGQVSFFAANAPPALAMGAPIELMPLLLAIDTLPDMIRTVANVTADLAATAVIAAQSGSVTGE